MTLPQLISKFLKTGAFKCFGISTTAARHKSDKTCTLPRMHSFKLNWKDFTELTIPILTTVRRHQRRVYPWDTVCCGFLGCSMPIAFASALLNSTRHSGEVEGRAVSREAPCTAGTNSTPSPPHLGGPLCLLFSLLYYSRELSKMESSSLFFCGWPASLTVSSSETARFWVPDAQQSDTPCGEEPYFVAHLPGHRQPAVLLWPMSLCTSV